MNINKLIKKTEMILSNVAIGIGIVSLLGMIFVVNLNVFYRYVLQDPLHAWYLDISLLFNLYMSFLVVAFLYHDDRLIRIDILIKRFPIKIRAFIELIIEVAIGVCLIVILWFAWPWQKVQWAYIAGGLGIPYSFFSISLLIGSLLMLVSNLKKIWNQFVVLFGLE